MKVPLSTFSTFVVAGPSAKITTVTNLKHGKYDPKYDYWKKLREEIPKNHQNGGMKKGLDAVLNTVSDTKTANYGLRIDEYKKWWGNRTIVWTGGSGGVWKCGTVEIPVNAEVLVSVNGVPHAIKLYFNKDKIAADRANVMLRLMEIVYGHKKPTPVIGVLDLGQGRLITPTAPLTYLDPFLAGEAASFAAIWRQV